MIPRQIIVDLVEGDDAPDLAVRFLGLDLSEYDSITMHVRRATGAKFSRAVTPNGTDPELGSISWEEGDLIRGRAQAEFEFVQTIDSKHFTVPQRYPVIFDIRRDLG
jgi:hypothetical protein